MALFDPKGNINVELDGDVMAKTQWRKVTQKPRQRDRYFAIKKVGCDTEYVCKLQKRSFTTFDLSLDREINDVSIKVYFKADIETGGKEVRQHIGGWYYDEDKEAYDLFDKWRYLSDKESIMFNLTSM